MFNPGQTAKRLKDKHRSVTRVSPDRYAADLLERVGKHEAAFFAERMNQTVEEIDKKTNTAGECVRLDEDPVLVRRTRAFWNQVHNLLKKKVA